VKTRKGWRGDRATKPLSIDLDRALFTAVKVVAAKDGVTVGQACRDLLRDGLALNGIDAGPPPLVRRGRPPKVDRKRP